ncbi:MAG: hypothetical protein P4M08_11140 [Oligoflexia bacterium]|nr:hypothetical protein [Oligoflexia bacterium]
MGKSISRAFKGAGPIAALAFFVAAGCSSQKYGVSVTGPNDLASANGANGSGSNANGSNPTGSTGGGSDPLPSSGSAGGTTDPLPSGGSTGGTSDPIPSGASGGSTDPIGGGTTISVQHIQPAIAVRGMGCLNCHADVQANIVTDFGYGNPWYLEQENSGYTSGTNMFTMAYYTPFSWQSTQQVLGQVMVPAENIPSALSTALGSSSTLSLGGMMTSAKTPDFASVWFSYFNLGAAPTYLPFDTYVTPQAVSSGTPLSPVVTEQTVYIGAPSSSQVLAIAPNSGLTGPWVQVAKGETGAGSGISGLAITSGAGSGFVTNSGPIHCSGLDVVINGTLLLNSAHVYAEKGGCRLYVTGSVFIEGPITYLNSGSTADPTDNLQITSATSVIMGVGLTGASYVPSGLEPGNNPLHTRLIDDARSPYFRIATTPAAYTTWANGVLAEANNIGPTLLVDASNTSGASSTAYSSTGQSRASINYQHLLLNAPVVHSRYLGSFSGVIVSEIALMSLGQFNFHYDSVFSNASVSVLPALTGDVLCVISSSSASTCNPVM